MKALVTGASGFLGRSIMRRLREDGIAVRALVRQGRSVDGLADEVIEGDICDDAAVAAAVAGMDWVVHAAARVTTSGSWEAFAEANVRATRRIIRVAHAAGAKCIVHISSLSVYAVPFDGVTITEASAYEGEGDARGYYSRSKLAADRAALDAVRSGAPVIVLRPGLLYGPGRRPPLARQSIDAWSLKLILSTRRYTLPVTYVDNVADAVLLAARAETAAIGKAFTLVDDYIPQAEYVALYRATSGERWHPVFLPVRVVAGAAWVAERAFRVARRRAPISAHQVWRATRNARYDCDRAGRLLGWRPAVGVREGLARSFASLRAERADTSAMAPSVCR